MTQQPLPLGQRESSRLEFKASEALKDSSSIGREVVAMLNADGGAVWIGIEEEDGVASKANDIEDVGLQARRLHDYLIDAIEPSPLNDEVVLDTPPIPDGGAVLRIEVRPEGGRKPYALLRGASRRYLIRVRDRNRPMSREEIAAGFREEPSIGDQKLTDAEQEMLEARRAVQQTGGQVFWLRLRPINPLDLDLREQDVQNVFHIPTLSGNRPAGWTFVNPYRAVELKRDRLAFHRGELRRDGTLTFEMPLDALHWKGEPDEIYPFSLLEYPVSALRIAKAIYQPSSLDRHDKIVADFALFGAHQWHLRPYSPQVLGYMTRGRNDFTEADDLVGDKPLVFRLEEIIDEPDWCAYRLAIRRTYEAFGYYEDEIPSEFDRDARRLVIEG